MAVFENTEKMYTVLGSLFEHLLADPATGPKFVESKITIKFIIDDPTGTIWLTDEGKVICGPADIKPTIQMTLNGDTCHLFWLQQISLPIALAKGKIKAKGPMPKVLKLLPMLKPAYEAYPEIARSFNLAV
ncbi:SCP2 sterol-binding domain-containing protein [bacterium]|nr:SCP2 sterol-binding domain-containing protein [bacterium]